MLAGNPYFTEYHFIKSFIGGLKSEIGNILQLMSPKSLSEAVQLAFKQEHLLNDSNKSSKSTSKSWNSFGNSFKLQYAYTTGGSKIKEKSSTDTEKIDIKNHNRVPPPKRLTPTEMDVRKRQNLCFNCDEVYHIVHKCKKVFVILVEGQGDDDNELIFEEPEDEITNPRVSLNALSGLQNPDTVKIAGKLGSQFITVLWDSGSTHSFVDSKTAKNLGCVVEYTTPLIVTITDGSKM